jgi:AraC-like DNA-binding protein/mannose-6-phosphate isomerase-like protein (cupin superfamily)
MPVRGIEFASVSAGRPYHAALVQATARRWVTEEHTHVGYMEIFFVTAGAGLHQVDSSSHLVSEGDLVLMRERDQHYFATTDGGADAKFAFINIAIPLESDKSLLLASGLAQREFDGRPEPPAISVRGQRRANVDHAFREALTAFQREPTQLDLMGVWVAAMYALCDGEKEAGAAPETPKWFATACDAMSEEGNLRVGVARMAEIAAVSRGHLARVMRQTHGCTPVEYITSRRLSHAEVLLASTSDPVGRIARRCGFSSLAYFTRQFTRHYGVSPRKYRYHRAGAGLGFSRLSPDSSAPSRATTREDQPGPMLDRSRS